MGEQNRAELHDDHGARIPSYAWFAFAATVGVLAYATWLALFVAPTEATMGNVQRIFYYHVPSSMVAEIFPYVNFLASAVYLYFRRRNPERAQAADALAVAAAEITVVFTSIGLASGMLWARPVWGIWWTWDERLTSFLLLWLLYVSYLMVRRFSSTGQTYTLAAILSVFAAIDVPIVFMSIRWWRTQHPAPVFGSGGSLDRSMWPAFLWNAAGWLMWGSFVCLARYKLERRRQAARERLAYAAIGSETFATPAALFRPRTQYGAATPCRLGSTPWKRGTLSSFTWACGSCRAATWAGSHGSGCAWGGRAQARTGRRLRLLRLAHVARLAGVRSLPLLSISRKARTVVSLACLAALPLAISGCRKPGFPDEPEGYREYAYVANAGANTVSVLDLVYLRPDRTLAVGLRPVALAVNPVRNELYAVNEQAGTVSVIDTDAIRVAATIAVHRLPGSIAVDPAGHRAYVANAGSNTISVLDLDQRREMAEIPSAAAPGPLRLSPDGRTLVVTHTAASTISVYGATGQGRGGPLSIRSTFTGCPGASDAVILPNSLKAFVACSAARGVMALQLAAPRESWAVRQDGAMALDRALVMLAVGGSPAHLTLKPDGGEVFVSNTDAGSFSEIATDTNEVGGTYMIGNHPAGGVVSGDNGTLYVANTGDDSVGLYSIDDGKLVSSVHTGAGPEALAFSADEHLLLGLDAGSGDVSVIRMQSKLGPNLFTILPAGSRPSAMVTMVVAARH